MSKKLQRLEFHGGDEEMGDCNSIVSSNHLGIHFYNEIVKSENQ